MVLLPAGLLLGKALIDKMDRDKAEVARTSAMLAEENFRHSKNTAGRRRVRGRRENPFAKEEIVNRMGGYRIRRQLSSTIGPPTELDEWVDVYQYTRVKRCRFLAWAKLSYLLTCLILSPMALYQFQSGEMDDVSLFSLTTLAIALYALLNYVCKDVDRLVATIAISSDEEWIRFGYVTSWGCYREKYLRVEEITPASDFDGKTQRVTITWDMGISYLNISTANCKILDWEKAQLLFEQDCFMEDKAKTD